MIVRYEIDDDNKNDYEIMEAKLMIIMGWDNGREINDDDDDDNGREINDDDDDDNGHEINDDGDGVR